MSYDDPKYGAKHTVYLGELGLNATANSVKAALKAFSKMKLQEARGYVTAAGTADASGWNILKGTASIGKLTIGTNTAGQFIDASLTDAEIANDGDFYLQNANSDTQGTAMVALEFQEQF